MIRKLASCIAIVAGVMGLSGCVKDTPNDKIGDELDFSQMKEVTLGSISTTTPMAVGKTFRLYAFPKGVTDIDKIITTRTYTIKDVAGQPILDPGQENLFLPIGDIDIFLVGPVKHDLNEGKIDANGNPLPPDMVDVATPYAVLPQYGIDLVSSKTPITIKVGANQFQAQPLVHRMAQMEVVVNRPNDATYTDLNVTAISVMNQTLSGVFEFNDKGGEITPAEEGTVTLSPVVRVTKPGEEFRATMYVIPRKQTQLRIGVFLTCKPQGGTAEVDRRMESGIMTESLVAGQMNRFITKPYLSDRLIFRLRLMPWDDVSAEDIDVPALDKMLFSYSGLDAPRMIDGKMCVPDRSGNNRHGELVGDIRYNAEEKYYYAGSKGAYIKVPELGSVPVYTLELTAASKRDAKSRVAAFKDDDGSASMEAYIPWNTNRVMFYAGRDSEQNMLSLEYNTNDVALMNNLAVYAFTCNVSRELTMRRNGEVLATKQGLSHNGQMNNNKLLWWTTSDEGKNEEPLKMYAARMTAAVSDVAIKNNYRNDIANFVGITVDKEYDKLNYIEDGLILDLRGTNGYSFWGSNFAWKDVSRAKNHAIVMSFSSPTYSNNCYTFNGSQYMQLLNTLGKLQNFTVEVVAKASKSDITLLNFASNTQGGDPFREFSIHLAYDDDVHCYSPYALSFGRKQLGVRKSMNGMNYSYDYQHNNPNQWSFSRYNESGRSVLEARLNGHMEVRNSVNETQLFEMRYCFIGSNGPISPQYFNTSIYAIRVYNRILTDLERQHNYQTDKLKYNLVP